VKEAIMGLGKMLEQVMTQPPQLNARSATERRAAAERKREDLQRDKDKDVQQLTAKLTARDQQYTQDLAVLNGQLKASNTERLAALVRDLDSKLMPLVRALSKEPKRSIVENIRQVLKEGLIQEETELEPTNSTPITLLVFGDTFCEVALEETPEAVNTFASGTCCIEALGAVRSSLGSAATLQPALLSLEALIMVYAFRNHGPVHERYARRWRVVRTRDPEVIAKFDLDEAAAQQQAFAASYVPPAGARVG
jgi:hypothetical protein